MRPPSPPLPHPWKSRGNPICYPECSSYVISISSLSVILLRKRWRQVMWFDYSIGTNMGMIRNMYKMWHYICYAGCEHVFRQTKCGSGPYKLSIFSHHYLSMYLSQFGLITLFPFVRKLHFQKCQQREVVINTFVIWNHSWTRI